MLDKKIFMIFWLYSLPLFCYGFSIPFNDHSFYFGLMGGYGSSTWAGLVPAKINENDAMIISTPIAVKEGGGMWGFYAGFEILPTFAIEGRYQHFPDTKVDFDPLSLVAFEYDGLTRLKT